MAFQAKDGKNFGNRQKMKAYDERGDKPAEPKAAPLPEPTDAPELGEPDADNVTSDNVVEVVKDLKSRVDALDGGGHPEPDADNLASAPPMFGGGGGTGIPGM